jgi:hypothetical protein
MESEEMPRDSLKLEEAIVGTERIELFAQIGGKWFMEEN